MVSKNDGRLHRNRRLIHKIFPVRPFAALCIQYYYSQSVVGRTSDREPPSPYATHIFGIKRVVLLCNSSPRFPLGSLTLSPLITPLSYHPRQLPLLIVSLGRLPPHWYQKLPPKARRMVRSLKTLGRRTVRTRRAVSRCRAFFAHL